MNNGLLRLVSVAAFAIFSCAGQGPAIAEQETSTNGSTMKIQLISPAFSEGQPIPLKHTCDGKDVSPPLQWTGIPSGTRSLALIVDDPDAPVGTWVHWVLYSLAPEATGLPENLDKSQYVLRGARQGLNDFKRLGYGGPCPPAGRPHRYFFKLYALDKELDLKPGATKKELLRAMEGHVLDEGQLMGTCARK